MRANGLMQKSSHPTSSVQSLLLLSFIAFLALGIGRSSNAKSWADERATTATEAELVETKGLAAEYVRVLVAFKGVYRIYGRDLAAAGVDLAKIDPRKLTLWNEWKEVPIAVKVKEEGRFGADDTIEFVGQPPVGTFSTYKPYNYYNVYFLSWEASQPLRYSTTVLRRGEATLTNSSFWTVLHLEQDNYYRESRLPRGITDNFYWCHYSSEQTGTYPIRVSFPHFDKNRGDRVHLHFRIFGWSDVPGLKPSHKFSIQYGDDVERDSPRYDCGTFAFDGVQYYDFVTSLPASVLGYRQRFIFKTPPDRANVVDSISLDWIRVSYWRKLDADHRNVFEFNSNVYGAKYPAQFSVKNAKPRSRVFCPSQAKIYEPFNPEATEIVVAADNRETTYLLVAENGILTPDVLDYRKRDRLSDFVSSSTEVLVLYDTYLRDPAMLYAAYRKQQGLEVAAVDVVRIFDEMNAGFIDDITLKRFIRYAAAKSPRLTYLVLFGDGTSDYRMCQTFDQADPPRVGIPIHWIESPATIRTGGYVDDNWYASFKSANTPDLAIGRIPAANEVQAYEYVRKVIEYETFQASKNDKMVVISSVESRFQDMAASVRDRYGDHFTTITLLFPETSVATREVERLREEIDHGIQFLYYIGHGGAFVWRVGPVDYSKQKDLFTPADVSKLRNRLHYPIIAASSCYTTAFDAQWSIGEAFLLQPKAGAIAVIGAPWKSSAYEDHAFHTRLLDFYCSSAYKRLGDAYQAAKAAFRPKDDDYVDVQTMTLIGDPCILLARKH
ncbi:MAG: hypothetical protein D6691_03235 [Candidatus Hydrogenedentota bacterium]|nr:MAG: hypothetical protein D6691_03235 [Candidatus Hydrogenedentota bacterium]GIX44339.1 MAG: hypothetical protein KatS3mg130_0747 [Candidatus Sumerlaea sp.]